MSVFSGSAPGPCPVCGAREMSCRGGEAAEPRGVIGAGFFTGQPPVTFRWRSRESVYGTDPKSGHHVQVYGLGTPIPAVEALRQGVATWDALTPDEVAGLKAHGVPDPREILIAAAPAEPVGGTSPQPKRETPAAEARTRAPRRKSPKGPPRDKMVREGGVRTK